jgi:hypothetical protein
MNIGLVINSKAAADTQRARWAFQEDMSKMTPFDHYQFLSTVLLNVSESTVLAEVHREWDLIDFYYKTSDKTDALCKGCDEYHVRDDDSHFPGDDTGYQIVCWCETEIKKCYVIQNSVNGKILNPIGSCCVQRFFGNSKNKEMRNTQHRFFYENYPLYLSIYEHNTDRKGKPNCKTFDWFVQRTCTMCHFKIRVNQKYKICKECEKKELDAVSKNMMLYLKTKK